MPRVGKGTRTNTNHKPQELPQKFRIGFLSDLDKRSSVFKVLKDRFEVVVQDLGGEQELGHLKRALVERFVWLEACLQDQEIQMASGELPKESISRWIQGVNALTGLAKTLGLERSIKNEWQTIDAKGSPK